MERNHHKENLKYLNDKEILSINKEELSKKISSYNYIENFKVSKLYPDNLVLTLKQTTLLASTLKQNKRYLIGSNAKLIDHDIFTNHNDLPTIYGNFKPEDFKVLHPGGNLGLQMLTVSQLMRNKSEMAIVKDDLTMSSVVASMTQSGFGVAILVDENGTLSGIITDGDLRRNIKDILTYSTRDIATLNPTSVKPIDLVSVALEKLEKFKVYAIVVIEDNKPIGLLRMHDVLRSGIK